MEGSRPLVIGGRTQFKGAEPRHELMIQRRDLHVVTDLERLNRRMMGACSEN